MNEFECETCGQNHKLQTLIEFPQPKIISEITRGEIDALPYTYLEQWVFFSLRLNYKKILNP